MIVENVPAGIDHRVIKQVNDLLANATFSVFGGDEEDRRMPGTATWA